MARRLGCDRWHVHPLLAGSVPIGSRLARRVLTSPIVETTRPDGTGLGLSIVEQIVSEHRGTVEYISEAGKGTAIIISLREID